VVSRNQGATIGFGKPSHGGPARLETIQVIRAIAALMVAAAHGIGESLKAVPVPGQTLLSVCIDRVSLA